ncbi:MAG: NFACT RNA binding domain-containing protein [Rhodothermus sp.]|nr:NFACT RNA binding domain-containing protein [Rhodothermus sp.]
MLHTYYTWRALADEWHRTLAGSLLADAFSQVRDELILAFAQPAAEWMVRISTGAFRYVFCVEGYSRARRNVATLFEEAQGRTLRSVRVAERDRVLFFELDDGSWFQCWLYGPRPNVLWVAPDGRVRAAFQRDEVWRGQKAPIPHPAPVVDSLEAFQARWRTDRKTLAQAVAAAFPLFDALLAQETVFRAGVQVPTPATCGVTELRRLYEAGRTLEKELACPTPRCYQVDRWTTHFALVPLAHLAHLPSETFTTVDAAVRTVVRRELAVRAFREAYEPLRQALEAAVARVRREQQALEATLARPDRADQYERWGHLLMAQAHQVPAGAEAVTLPDWFGDGTGVRIPLDPTRSAVENAQAYYERARQTRQERAALRQRLDDVRQRLSQLEALLAELEPVDTMAALRAFRQRHTRELAALGLGRASQKQSSAAPAFRRVPLGGGFEAWIGRNARENDTLTFHHARKYDLWLHARGVPGSHVILRVPGRNRRPDRKVLERAASLAAYFSKARGSSVVPVVVVPRKYVRKPRGAEPGTVVFEREEVLLVEPRPPEAVQTENS